VTDGTDGPGKRNSKRRPTISRRPSPRGVPEEDEQDDNEEVTVVKVAKEEVEEAPPVTLVVPKSVGTLNMALNPMYNSFKTLQIIEVASYSVFFSQFYDEEVFHPAVFRTELTITGVLSMTCCCYGTI